MEVRRAADRGSRRSGRRPLGARMTPKYLSTGPLAVVAVVWISMCWTLPSQAAETAPPGVRIKDFWVFYQNTVANPGALEQAITLMKQRQTAGLHGDLAVRQQAGEVPTARAGLRPELAETPPGLHRASNGTDRSRGGDGLYGRVHGRRPESGRRNARPRREVRGPGRPTAALRHDRETGQWLARAGGEATCPWAGPSTSPAASRFATSGLRAAAGPRCGRNMGGADRAPCG